MMPSEMPILPKGWSTPPIYARFSVQLGKMLDEKQIKGTMLAPYLRNTDVQWDKINVSELPEMDFSLEDRKKFALREGDILVCEGGEVGRTAIWNGELALCFYQKAIHRLRPITTHDEPNFFRYFMHMAFDQNWFSQSTASTILHLPAEKLRNVRYPAPPLLDQRRIARFLDRETAEIDALIAAKQRLLDLLAEKRRAIVAEAVMRGLNPAAPLRPSDIDWLGEIPAHWEVRRVATLFTQRDERNQPELPLLEVSINSGVIVREFSDDKIEGTVSDFNTYKVARRGNIAFNKMRMWQGAVGVAPVDGLVSPDYTVVEADSCLRPEYAGLLFRTGSFSAECGRNSQGITWDRLRLYWDGFRDIFMPLPPLGEQDAILDAAQAKAAKIDRLRAAAEQSITLLKERRGALIAAAITGQIDIPEAA